MSISGNGTNGNAHINIAVPGFNAIITTGGGYLGDLIERIVFGLFVYYFYLKVSAATIATSSIMAFTAPIFRYGTCQRPTGNGRPERTGAHHQRGVARFISVLCRFYLRYSWFYLSRSLVLSRGFRLVNSPLTHR